MKAIYDAARDLLYPKHTENATGTAFSHGINSYRASLRHALTAFEHANRGHRHLLDTPALSLAHAGRPAGPYSDQQFRSMRAKLRDTAYALAHAVKQGDPHPPTAALKKLLATPDTSGWLGHFANGALYQLCLHSKRVGLDQDFYMIAVIDVQETQVLMRVTVYDKSTNLKADRDLAPIPAAATTLGGLAPLLRDGRAALEKLVADVKAWPEFAKRDQVIAEFCD